jgi:hypothetical protein
LIFISERQLTSVLFETAEHVEFGAKRIVSRRPIDPQIALKQLYDLAAVMGSRPSAFLAAKFCNAFSYGTICFPDVDDGLASEPALAFIGRIKEGFRHMIEREFARGAYFRGIADPGNEIDTGLQLRRVFGRLYPPTDRAVGG